MTGRGYVDSRGFFFTCVADADANRKCVKTESIVTHTDVLKFSRNVQSTHRGKTHTHKHTDAQLISSCRLSLF